MASALELLNTMLSNSQNEFKENVTFGKQVIVGPNDSTLQSQDGMELNYHGFKHNGTYIEIEGFEHSPVRVFLPSNYFSLAACPLLVFCHGYTNHPEQIYRNRANAGGTYNSAHAYRTMAMLPAVEAKGMIVALPRGNVATNKALEQYAWINNPYDAAAPSGFSQDDFDGPLKFMRKLFITLINTYNVDKSMVFLGGYSNGGQISREVAPYVSDIISGIYTFGATGLIKEIQKPIPFTGSVPVLCVHGKNDSVVSWSGTQGSPNIRGSIENVTEFLEKQGTVTVEQMTVDSNKVYQPVSSGSEVTVFTTVTQDYGTFTSEVWNTIDGRHGFDGGAPNTPDFMPNVSKYIDDVFEWMVSKKRLDVELNSTIKTAYAEPAPLPPFSPELNPIFASAIAGIKDGIVFEPVPGTTPIGKSFTVYSEVTFLPGIYASAPFAGNIDITISDSEIVFTLEPNGTPQPGVSFPENKIVFTDENNVIRIPFTPSTDMAKTYLETAYTPVAENQKWSNIFGNSVTDTRAQMYFNDDFTEILPGSFLDWFAGISAGRIGAGNWIDSGRQPSYTPSRLAPISEQELNDAKALFASGLIV